MPRSTDEPGARRASDTLREAFTQLQISSDKKHDENLRNFEAMNAKIDRVIKGFPEGDPEGHRRYHEAMIRKAEKRAEFWDAMLGKLLERGIWAVIGFLAVAAYIYLKEGPRT